MELALECGACANIQLSRTLGARAADWRTPYGTALAAIAEAYRTASEPSEVLAALYRSVAESLRDGDFYQAIKDAANAQAEAWWAREGPELSALANRILLAADANAIDAGVDVAPDVVFAHFEAARNAPPGRDDRALFIGWLLARKTAPHVLYVLDNAGEAVFDREVMRTLSARGAVVRAMVRGGAVLNDVTRREADLLHLEQVAEVLDTETPGYGLVEWMRGRAAASVIEQADVVISKGIANLETLSHRRLGRPVLFLYRAKCGPSARAAGAPPGSTVIWWRPDPKVYGRPQVSTRTAPG